MPSDRQKLIPKLDDAFSRLVRLRAADERGWVRCFTCNEWRFWADLDCGHYVPREHHVTRWDFDNARPQCQTCNRYGRLDGPGEPRIFGRRLASECVDVAALELRGRQLDNRTLSDYQDLLSSFRAELNKLEPVAMG